MTALGLDYSMMTSYTSFVAVMDEVRNTTGEGRDVDQPLPLPLHVSDLAVGRGYTIGSEPDILLLAAAAALILILNIRNTTAAVSYTHLDVYKRQSWHHTGGNPAVLGSLVHAHEKSRYIVGFRVAGFCALDQPIVPLGCKDILVLKPGFPELMVHIGGQHKMLSFAHHPKDLEI